MQTGITASVLLCLEVEWSNTIKMHDAKLIFSVSNEETGLISGAASTEAVCGGLRSCDPGKVGASNPFSFFWPGRHVGRGCAGSEPCGLALVPTGTRSGDARPV